MAHPTLYMFVGYPGAGKTTVAQWVCEATGAAHIWADRERHLMFPNPTHSPEESARLYDRLNQKTAELLRSGESVVFDTSFNFRKDRDHLRRIADQAGAVTCIIWMTTPKDIAQARALHGDHSERNGYDMVMDEATFERIAGHLEAPDEDENVAKFSGQDLDRSEVLAELGLL